MSTYGISKFIKEEDPFPDTKLSRRLAPRTSKIDLKTREFRTYRIPIVPLRSRVKTEENDCLLENNNSENISYLPFDLPYSWKDPTYWKFELKTFEEDEPEYRTIDEAFEVDPDQDYNEVFIFSSFNLISKHDFYDKSLKKWKIRNSTDLENAIHCTCILIDIKGLLFNKKNLLNIEEKRKTRKGTEKGLVALTNLANEGLSPKMDKNGNFTLLHGKGQDLPFNSLVEWYVSYFDNETPGLELIKLDKNKEISITNPNWISEYKKCLPKEYRGEGRFTLMYRRYDETRENDLVKEYALKSRFLSSVVRELKVDKKKFLEIIIKFLLTLNEYEKKYVNIKEYMDLITRSKKKNEKYKNRTNIETKKLQKYFSLFQSYLKDPSLGIKTFGLFKEFKGYKFFRDALNKLDPNLRAELTGEIVGLNPLSDIPFGIFLRYREMQKELLTEFSSKLHKMRSKIFARVMKGGKYKETIWMFLFFKEPQK